jgi:hypothetical protein
MREGIERRAPETTTKNAKEACMNSAQANERYVAQGSGSDSAASMMRGPWYPQRGDFSMLDLGEI